MAKTTAQMLAEAKAAGVKVTVTVKSTDGEIVLLPALRATGR